MSLYAYLQGSPTKPVCKWVSRRKGRIISFTSSCFSCKGFFGNGHMGLDESVCSGRGPLGPQGPPGGALGPKKGVFGFSGGGGLCVYVDPH